MHCFLLLLLLVPSTLFAQGISGTEWAQMAYEKGSQYETDHDWVNALRFYEEAVSRASGNPDYRYHAAYAAAQLSQLEKARALLEPNLLKEHPPSLYFYAMLLLQQGNIARARQWFEKGLLLDPGNPQPYFGLAQCAEASFKAGNTAAKPHAIAHYQAYLARAIDGEKRDEAQKKVRELQYGQLGIELNRAIGVLMTGQSSRAERMLQKISPSLKEAFYWLGVIAQNRGDDATAENYWTQALPEPLAQLALARQQMARGEYTKALDWLLAAQRRGPHLIEISLDVGRVYLELHRHEEAKNELRRLLREAPQRPEAQRASALLQQLEATTDLQEIEGSIGPLTEAQLRQRYGGELYDPILQERLEALILRLRAGTPELASRRFQVRLLQSSSVSNAWPIPPNTIMMTQGLVQFVQSSPDLRHLADDVLAFILGHEITHLIEGDVEQASELQPLGAGDVTAFRIQKAILHQREYNADRRGAMIAYQGQFDPFAAVVWLQASQNRYGDSAEGSSHPTFGQRQTALHQFLSQELMEAYRQFKRGVALLQKGEPQGAASAFEMYLAKLPTDTQAQYNLALAYFHLGLAQVSVSPWSPWELASEIATEPLLVEPRPPAKSITPEASRWLKRALAEVESILRHHPDHTASWRLRGDVALAYRDGTNARKSYEEALRLHPGDGATRNNLGVLACLENRFLEARQQFQSCLQKNSVTQPIARRNLERLRE